MKLRKGYVYKITVTNRKSELHGCTYIGRHKTNKFFSNETDALNDGYYGSGKILKQYYDVWGKGYGVHKEIIEWIYTWENQSKVEMKHIQEDLKDKGFLFWKKKSKNINLLGR